MNNLSKAIKTAIKLEEDGIDFYQKASEKTSHPFGKKMFLSFAEDEKRHLTILRIAANSDELEALKIGMDMESKSVEFYQGALEKTQDSHQKAFFNRLIDEEKEHYELLQNTRSYLKDSGEWFLWEEKALLDGG